MSLRPWSILLDAVLLSLTEPLAAQPVRSTDVSAAGDHTCAILEDATVKCWGNGDDGHLGLGDVRHRGDNAGEMGNNLPVVDLGAGRTVVKQTGGAYHRCVLLDNDELKCWGRGDEGQLGYEKQEFRGAAPNTMGSVLPAVNLGTALKASVIAAGDYHSCAVLNNSRLKCWGQGAEGQLGYGASDDRGESAGEMGDRLPFVNVGTNRTVKSVTCGDFHTCVLLDDNSVKCWGDSLQGQLGYGTAIRRGAAAGDMGDNLPVVDLGTGRSATKISAGWFHTCAILDNGGVKCWGYGGHGQLGQGDKPDRGKLPGEMGDSLPLVNLGTGRTAVDIAAGATFTCVRLDNGDTKCWGENESGQLGMGDSEGRGDGPGEMGDALPAVDFGSGRKAVSLSSGDRHTCVILNDGLLKCWGENRYGQLGLGNVLTYGNTSGTMGEGLPPIALGAPLPDIPTTTVNRATAAPEPQLPAGPAITAFSNSSDTQPGFAWSSNRVVAVEAGSWASAVGMTVGDTIVSLNGRSVASMTTAEIVEALKINKPLTLVFVPNGTANGGPQQISTLAKGSRFSVSATSKDMPLGFSWPPMTPPPVTLSQVALGTWAYKAGLTVGDMLLAVNGKSVVGMTGPDLQQMLQKTRPLDLLFAKGNGTSVEKPWWYQSSTTTPSEPWAEDGLLASDAFLTGPRTVAAAMLFLAGL